MKLNVHVLFERHAWRHLNTEVESVCQKWRQQPSAFTLLSFSNDVKHVDSRKFIKFDKLNSRRHSWSWYSYKCREPYFIVSSFAMYISLNVMVYIDARFSKIVKTLYCISEHHISIHLRKKIEVKTGGVRVFALRVTMSVLILFINIFLSQSHHWCLTISILQQQLCYFWLYIPQADQ